MKFSIRSSANQENIIHHQSTSANQSSPPKKEKEKVVVNKVKERRISVCMFIMFKHVTGWVS